MEAQYAAARANYALALTAFRALPDRLGEANTLRGMASVEQAEKHWQAALGYFEQAGDIYRSLPDEYSFCIVLTERIPSLVALSRHEEAVAGAIRAFNYDVSIGAHQAIRVDMRDLKNLKAQIGSEAFDAAWEATTDGQPQPEWLAE
jgi:tetratricopeptide (TPR) repeat protein